MLELIAIWRLIVLVGGIARQKALRGIGYQIMAAACWLGGELTGGMIGNLFFDSKTQFWPIYIFAVVGALIGVTLAFVVMHLLPDQSAGRGFGRSAWLPVLVILVVLACLAVTFGAVVIIEGLKMASAGGSAVLR